MRHCVANALSLLLPVSFVFVDPESEEIYQLETMLSATLSCDHRVSQNNACHFDHFRRHQYLFRLGLDLSYRDAPTIDVRCPTIDVIVKKKNHFSTSPSCEGCVHRCHIIVGACQWHFKSIVVWFMPRVCDKRWLKDSVTITTRLHSRIRGTTTNEHISILLL